VAQEGLGRLFNVVPIAAGVALNFAIAPAITFVCTGNDTFTLTVATSFGASYVTPPTTAIGGGLIRNYYTNTSTNGTAAWAKTTLSISAATCVNAVTISSGTVAFAVYSVDLPAFGASDTTNYEYIKCSVGSGGLVTAILHDPYHQRTPANLTLPSA
jgi:hypothetical protein